MITIDVKNRVLLFYNFLWKARFLTFLFLERFLFSSGETFYPTKPAIFFIKRILSDGFKMADIKILS